MQEKLRSQLLSPCVRLVIEITVIPALLELLDISLLKRWHINLLNQETSFKRSTRQKTKQASMDVGYLLQVSIPSNSN